MDPITGEQIKNHIRAALIAGDLAEPEIRYLFLNILQVSVIKAIMSGNTTINNIAKYMRTYQSTVANCIKKLEDKGYVRRVKVGVKDADIIQLTDAVKELVRLENV